MTTFRRVMAWPLAFVLIALFWTQAALAEGPPAPGGVLTDLVLPAPASEANAAYLGVPAGEPFTLKQAGAPYLLIEVIGVYCPICFKQAPLMDQLMKKIKSNKDLSKKVRLLGLACGATPQELEALAKQKLYAFPVVGDQDYSIHKLLGQPKTPFTMLVDREGKVLAAHLGMIDDINAFYRELTKLAQ